MSTEPPHSDKADQPSIRPPVPPQVELKVEGRDDARIRDVSQIGQQVNVYQNIARRLAAPEPERLAAAQRQLACLPLGEVPKPASLPHGSRMPLSHNPLFVGRENVLKDLAATFRGADGAAVGQVTIA